jgi:hypothetical protein
MPSLSIFLAVSAVIASRHTLTTWTPIAKCYLWPVSRPVNRAGNDNDPKLIEAIH